MVRSSMQIKDTDVFSESTYDRLLDKAAERVKIPPNSIVALEGSLAEGFGNQTSDVDFVVIDRTGREFQTIPTVLFIDNRRVEVRVRSAETMRSQINEVAQAARAGGRKLAGLDEEVLDRCQRFLRSIPMRNGDELNAMKAQMAFRDLCSTVSAWFAEQTWETLGVLSAMTALSQYSEAVSWTKSALSVAVKSWLADKGETYLAKKWISHQLDRAGAKGGLKEQFLALESPEKAGMSERTYIEAALQFLATLGFHVDPADGEKIILKKAAGITTWQIGSRVHVVSQRSDVFALSAEAGYLWRQLAFGKPTLQTVRNTGDQIKNAAGMLSEFHQYGLVKFVQPGRGEIRLRKPYVPAPSAGLLVLGIEGLVFDSDEKNVIQLAPIPARRFAAAGMELVYVNMIVENAREDALGALHDGQWQVFERSIRRMLRFACKAALSAAGTNPLPPIEEVVLRAAALPMLPPEIRSCVIGLEQSIKVQNRDEAEYLLNCIDALTRGIRGATQSALFPSSFLSLSAWRETLEIGYDWARLGGFLDADFPLDQARDLIASGGQKDRHNANVLS